jgi:hypothetical protein
VRALHAAREADPPFQGLVPGGVDTQAFGLGSGCVAPSGLAHDDGVGLAHDDGVGLAHDDGVGLAHDDGVGLAHDDGAGPVRDDRARLVRTVTA